MSQHSKGARRASHQSARLLLLLLALACGPDPAPEAAERASPSAVPLVHNVFGMPGPWWRVASSPDDFEVDLRACRRESSRARQRARKADPLDAAYRAFLTCMDERGWQRGLPPEPA